MRACVSTPKMLRRKTRLRQIVMSAAAVFCIFSETRLFICGTKIEKEKDMKRTTRKRIGLALALLFVLVLLPSAVFAAEATLEGSGTDADPYLIADAEDLKAFRDLVNAEASSKLCAKLIEDIDLNSEAWTPFNPASGYVTEAYAGVFDGNGHTVSGLSVNAPGAGTTDGIGFFGTVNGATVKNLRIVGSVSASSRFVGGIIGKTQGSVTVENCSFHGAVTSTASGSNAGAAGIIGRINSGSVTVRNCFNSADVTGFNSAGIVAYGSATGSSIENCYNTGTISGSNRAGGMAGQMHNNTVFQNCYNIGKIGGSAAFTGGISAFNNQNARNCFYKDADTQNPGGSEAAAGEVRQISEISDLLSAIGEAFAADLNAINNGYPILKWQSSETPEPAVPGISIVSADGGTLWVQTGGDHPNATALSVRCENMGDAVPEVTWTFSSDEIADIEIPVNDANGRIVTAKQGGALTAAASVTFEDTVYTAEYEIKIIPYFTMAEIVNADKPGAVAVGQTVQAVLYMEGGGVYDPTDYPDLEVTYQWYHRTSGGDTSVIPGETDRTFVISDAFEEWDYVAVEVKCAGEIVHDRQDHQAWVRSADYGTLYPVAYDEAFTISAEVKTDAPLYLPTTYVKGDVCAAVEWSSNSSVISASGAVARPESGKAEVTLTAKFSYGSAFANRTFTVMVWSDDAVKSEIAKSELERAAESLGAYYTLHPVFGTDTNVTEMLESDLAENEIFGIDASVKQVEEVYGNAGIDENGDITYFYVDPNAVPSVRFGSYRVTFVLHKDGETLEYGPVSVVVYWDADRVKAVMTDEILDKVAEAVILAEGDQADQVTQNLILPKAVDGKVWTLISWKSSNEKVLSVSSEDQTTPDTLFDPYVGVVKPGDIAQEVVLTATFTFQLTSDVIGTENPITLHKVFHLKVAPAEDETVKEIRRQLLAKLDAGFEAAGLSDAVTGERLAADGNAIYTAYHDIQLPTTRDFGVDGKYHPITITSSDSDVIAAPDVKNAARVAVYRPGAGCEDGMAVITVTIADPNTNITASREFTVSVPSLTKEEIDAELLLMAKVKENYFAGLNNGANADQETVLENLCAFQEVYEDENGNLIWVRDHKDLVNHGIVPTPIEGWEELEAWRLFKSSNPAVITHENLLVTRQFRTKGVTIVSYLSSETLGRYGELYRKDPVTYRQYADLAGLYYQEVTAEIVVPGYQYALSNRQLSRAVVVETLDVSFVLRGPDGAWIDTVNISGLNETCSVYDVFRDVLSERGYTFTRERGTYIVSITTPDGETLAEESRGENSGWLYRVNGKIPDVYMGACGLHDGDRIQVFFTDDYTKESGYVNDDWSKPSSSGQTFAGSKPKEEKIRIEKIEDETDGDRYIVTIPDSWSGNQTVAISGVKEDQLVVVVEPNGSEKIIKKSFVDQEQAVFLLSGSATVKLTEYANHFDDVLSDAWYFPAVNFAAGRGLFIGISSYRFAPDMFLSRGMMVTALYHLEEPETQQSDERLFSDVAENDWYAESTAWAASAGIVNGYDNGMFGPNDLITREQLAALLFRYADNLNMSTGGRDTLNSFRDRAEVSDWALEAIAWAVDNGIINGRPEGILDPGGYATRAEAAAMIRQLVSLMVR